MKIGTALFVGATVFVAVYGALQLDHRMHSTEHRTEFGNPLPLPAPVIEPAVYEPDSGGSLDFRAAAKKVIPSVVSVERYEREADWLGNLSDRIQETATGSGVILGADGLIVTNNHVVADENGNAVEQVKVKLNDTRSFTAKVIGTDPRSDLAIIKISGDNLVPAEVGTSSSLQIGQWVMAVGNPLGFDDTVTVGVVSSLKRDLPINRTHGLTNAIQTDAAINPGNSGGALCDQHGRLVGINSAIASGNGGSVGIGFAIPVDRVRDVVNDILKFGHARYASLGVSFLRNVEGALADERARQYVAQQSGATPESVPSTGLIIGDAAGPSAQAGLKAWDVLLSIDGSPVDSYWSVNRVMVQKKPFDKVAIKWWSKGATKTATVTLQESGGATQ